MRKVLTLSIFILGVIIGFSIFILLGAKKKYGEPKLGFNSILYFPDSKKAKKCLHIHHWIWCLIIIICIIFGIIIIIYGTHHKLMNILHDDLNVLFYSGVFMIGFLLGAALDDLRYPDWNVFRIHCPHHKTILQSLEEES